MHISQNTGGSTRVKMDFSLSKTFLIDEDFKVVVSSWQLHSTIFLVNKTEKFAYLDVDKWTEFKKSISDIDDEVNMRVNCQYPTLDLSQAKTLIITNDFKIVISNWSKGTTIFMVNNNGKYHFAFMDVKNWRELKDRIKDIDTEFTKRFNYQYPVV